MLLALLGLHLVLALGLLGLRRPGRAAFGIGALGPLAAVVYAALQAPQVLDGRPVVQRQPWVGAYDLDLVLRLDAFTLVMVALVSGIGVLIFAYAAWYFPRDERHGGFASALLAFSGAMLGLVLADHLIVLYVFWELTSVTSYVLIAHNHEQEGARGAALQALLITSLGGLVMLAGLVMLGQAGGTYELSALLADPPLDTLGTAGAFIALAGAFTKSAQVPFHTWLPSAMAAPTPVSAYLHSATMVKAGVYLIARLAPAYADVAAWRPLLLGVGLATMLVGGWRALRQMDLKLLLAFGTVSQLGFMVTLFGMGAGELVFAAVALILAHAMFKATLFMVVGIIDHEAGTRDMRELSGLGRRMPVLAALGVVAGASMAGLPPLFGFISKEFAYESFLAESGELGWLSVVGLVGIVAGSVLTFAYTARFLHGAFADKSRPATSVHAAPVGFWAPAAVLVVLTILAGLVPSLLDGLARAATTALEPPFDPPHLKLFKGFTPAFWLSVLTIALGLALWWSRDAVERVQRRVAVPRGATWAYQRSLAGVLLASERITGVVQSGSLPVYLGVILLTAVVVPGSALLGVRTLPSVELAASPYQVLVCLGVAAAAIALVFLRRRFPTVLTLGAVGYGVALLFVLQGAPDLALTQLLIETLSLVVFVLVLRHLPTQFEHNRWRLGQNLRRLTAVAVGVFIGVFGLLAGASRTASPISEGYLDRSISEAHGKNVVNVILVDFRGFDTFGEITVLATATVGVTALVLAVRRDSRRQADLGLGEAGLGGDGSEGGGLDGGGPDRGGPDGAGPDGGGRRRLAPGSAGDPRGPGHPPSDGRRGAVPATSQGRD